MLLILLCMNCMWSLELYMYTAPVCSETTLTGESRFHLSTPQGIWTQVSCDGKQRVSPLDQWDMVRMKRDYRLSTGLPPSSSRHKGLVTVWDEARLRRGHNDDQSCWGHQCSKTMLTGESRFHLSTPQGIWTKVPCDGKQSVSPLDQWDMVRMKWDWRSTGLY